MKTSRKLQVFSNHSNVKATGNAVSALSLAKQKSLLDTWATDILGEYRNTEFAERYSSLDEYLSANAFFVTATFHRAKMAKRKWDHSFKQSDTRLEMDAFHNLYNAVARRVLGNHWDRPSQANRRIMAIVAMDHPESKFGRTAGSITTNLHWHAIVVGRSDVRDDLAAALTDAELVDKFKHLTLADRLDVRVWEAGSTKDYTLKSFIKSANAPNPGIDDLRVYPKPGTSSGMGWGYLVQRSRQSKSVERILAGMRREAVREEIYYVLNGVPLWE